MKKILITQRLFEHSEYVEQREMLDVKWGSLFNELNFLPIVLPIEFDFENYFKEFSIDGLLLTGGNDLNSTNKNDILSFKRDLFEKKLIDYAITNNIPILGICRGLQVIAEYFGSTMKTVSGQVAIQHRLNINKESKYSKELSYLSKVNSFHNYAIDHLGEELIVSATNESGIIKAIEHTHYNIFAQMWHSERENPFNEYELNLIKKVFND